MAARSKSYVAGVAISWIAVFAALVGFTNLVPLLPYPAGGGYFPLAVSVAGVAAFVLGPWAGAIAAFLGGVLGIFITPAAYPMYILDALQVSMYPALFIGLAVNGEKHWKIFAPIYIVFAILSNLIPYYFPGEAMGFKVPPQPLYFLSLAYYWVPWLAIYLSPIGTKYLPQWARSEDPKKQMSAVLIASLIGFMCYYVSNTFWIYWYWLSYPYDLVLVESLYFYTWYIPVFAIVTTIITVPVVRALKRSGFLSPPEAIW